MLQLIAIPLLQYGLHYGSNTVVMQIIIFDQIFLLVTSDLSFDFLQELFQAKTIIDKIQLERFILNYIGQY